MKKGGKMDIELDRPEVIRLWGHADSFDIEFTHDKGYHWHCDIPADTKDGIYAVELWALNVYNEISYWIGELYMTNGVCHLKLNKPKYTIYFRKGCSRNNGRHY